MLLLTPTPLRPDGTKLLPFPVNALPPIIGDMADAIATTTSTDVAMAGTSILSAVSYCFSGVYRMSAKRDHTEPLVLYSLTVATQLQEIASYFFGEASLRNIRPRLEREQQA